MLLFSVSDKGGTGRSVTSTNLAYRAALQGFDTVYLDFDFGSPTVGAIFEVEHARSGVRNRGLHEYLYGETNEPLRIDVWSESNRETITRPLGARALVLMPGTLGGSEFLQLDEQMVQRCADLFLRLQEEFEFCVVDLSAGRSAAMDLVLRATAGGRAREIPTRWLVFHRWTRQHVIAAGNLVHGDHGLIKYGVSCGFGVEEMEEMISFVRTAVIDPDGEGARILNSAQQAWLVEVDRDLELLASDCRLGRDLRIGSIPLDPVLQWREQLITDKDAHSTRVANPGTAEAFKTLSEKLCEPVRALRDSRR
jgi:hypothetical protein